MELLAFYLLTVLSISSLIGDSFRGGSRIPRRRGRQPMVLPKNSKKLHEIENILGWGGGVEPSLDPPLSLELPMRFTNIFTARKRSLRRLCFYRCLSVHGGGGVSIPGGSPLGSPSGFSILGGLRLIYLVRNIIISSEQSVGPVNRTLKETVRSLSVKCVMYNCDVNTRNSLVFTFVFCGFKKPCCLFS